MNNTIPVPGGLGWHDLKTPLEAARYLLEEVRLIGRVLKAHGRIPVRMSLCGRCEAADSSKTSLEYLLFSRGMLLFDFAVDWGSGGPEGGCAALWVPDVDHCGLPLVKACLQGIRSTLRDGTWDRYHYSELIDSRITEIHFLEENLIQYVAPIEYLPERLQLETYEDERCRFLGLRFFDDGYRGCLDLKWMNLTVMDHAWRYSWHPGIMREPRMAIPFHMADFVAVPGLDYKELECSPHETRDCMMFLPCTIGALDMAESLCMSISPEWKFETPILEECRRDWKKLIEFWHVMRDHDSWESFFETLCAPDYQRHVLDDTWLHCFNKYGWSELYQRPGTAWETMMPTLKYIFDWLEPVVEKHGGVLCYYLF